MRYFSEDIAIDLGTANSAVYVRGQGIVINEPSVVALNTKTGQILAVGEEAKKMVGRTPAHIQAVRPLVRGVVSDFEVTEQMLRYFIEKVHHKKFISLSWPRIIVGIPSRVTEVEKKAVEDAAKNAGAREVFLIEEPVAAAIGARLPIQEAKGTFIIDIGGGTTDIAVISLGGIVTSQSLSIAGDKLSDDIVQYVQQKYQLLIGERTAEEAKISIGCAVPLKEKKEFRLRGRNLVSGLPEEVIVDSEDIRKAMEKSLNAMMEAVKGIIESTPPELLADIMGSGIYIVGGGALLAGLDVLLSAATRMKVKIIEDPLTAVVRGGGIVLENLDTLREVLADTSSGMAIK
ncbi:rod shape-determining protein [bacterium (Candidatus Gribaldobacteria) CG_4_10_14_0_2_um_filter_41_16]|uniref:Cell shape-determining protein MreB n=1 Tax=bacterium (Candidatus Gribaldobacteria) CG_4_10_14_0_2_um_filter_41_16 TaxID=2014265 RepID=A0A2M7VIZ9_9BACT|nr:MAG: rod shape-determining protein [bacterium (Candidatus Gribaldobacteria) CG_4_10_14_0_2_um_filter_41_16]